MSFSRTWTVAALLAYFLLACARHVVTADEAKVEAKAELRRAGPEMGDLRSVQDHQPRCDRQTNGV